MIGLYHRGWVLAWCFLIRVSYTAFLFSCLVTNVMIMITSGDITVYGCSNWF